MLVTDRLTLLRAQRSFLKRFQEVTLCTVKSAFTFNLKLKQETCFSSKK